MSEKDFDCESCSKNLNNLFSKLNGDPLDKLKSNKSTQDYKKGHILFAEGSEAHSVFCIRSGLVKLIKKGRNNEEIVLKLLKSGDVIGQRAIIANEQYAVTAIVLQYSYICTIDKSDFLEIIKDAPGINQNIMKDFAKDNRISKEKLLSRSQESVRQRTARLLLELNMMSGGNTDNGVKLNIPVLKSEMAQMIGTTPETFSRSLSYFATRGLIKLSRKEITVLQPSAMKLMIKQY